MASQPPETVGQAVGDTPGPSLAAGAGGTARAPRKANLPVTHRIALEQQFVHQWLHVNNANGEYDHSTAAEDENAALLAAWASQRLPATNKAGPVTADQAARWALGAIPPLLPRAIQKLSGNRWTNMMAVAAKAPDAQKPSQEALERLLHTGLVPATVAACWAGARAKLAGGSAVAAGGSGGARAARAGGGGGRAEDAIATAGHAQEFEPKHPGWRGSDLRQGSTNHERGV